MVPCSSTATFALGPRLPAVTKQTRGQPPPNISRSPTGSPLQHGVALSGDEVDMRWVHTVRRGRMSKPAEEPLTGPYPATEPHAGWGPSRGRP